MPSGEEDSAHVKNNKEGTLEKVAITGKMAHAVMAVVYARAGDKPETVRNATVMGFVYIAEVDEKKHKVRVLAPLSGRLGDRPFVWGRFPEPVFNLV